MVVIRSPSPQLVPFKLYRFGQQRLSNIKRIVKYLRGDNVSGLSVEIIRDKQAYRVGTGSLENTSSFSNAITWHVDILSAARKVSNVLFQPLTVKDFNISMEDEETLMRYATLLEGDLIETVEAGHEFCQGVLSPDGHKSYNEELHGINQPSVHFVEDEGNFFNLLGNQIKPPPVNIDIEPCAVNRFSYIAGDNVGKDGFVIYAIDGTKCVVSLHKERQWVFDVNN